MSQRTARWAAPWLALLSLGACAADASDDQPFGFETGPTMQPGDNCLRCHRSERTDYPTAPPWSAAGTVFASSDAATSAGVQGVQVLISAPDGTVIDTLTTNEAGNFYTASALPTGFVVALEYEGERIEMPCPPPAGNCGACHSQPPIGGAPGRIYIPQASPGPSTFDCAAFGQ